MKKQKAPRLVTLSIFTTITIIFWIFYSLYTVLTSKPEVIVSPEILEPVTPSLDLNALEDVEKRVFFNKNDVAPIFAQPINEPSPPVPVIVQTNEKQTVATASAKGLPTKTVH